MVFQPDDARTTHLIVAICAASLKDREGERLNFGVVACIKPAESALRLESNFESALGENKYNARARSERIRCPRYTMFAGWIVIIYSGCVEFMC